ncbi:hypothetical protein HK1_00729 [Tepidibacillus sp. HK-1]|nr:hypothetical protein HK1_00729 [Tepidibacillus sp. HK-1]
MVKFASALTSPHQKKLEIQKEKLKNMRDQQGVPENLNTILLIESHVHPYLTFLPKK